MDCISLVLVETSVMLTSSLINIIDLAGELEAETIFVKSINKDNIYELQSLF